MSIFMEKSPVILTDEHHHIKLVGQLVNASMLTICVQ